MTTILRDARPAGGITRRGILAGTAGLAFAVTLGPKGLSLIAEAGATASGRQIGAWVRIAPDNRITIVTPAAEMGQGSMTGVPVALAEELDADWDTVTLEMAPADPEVYGYTSWGGRKSMGIYGSLAVRSYFTQMRLIGAAVRKVLVSAAAEKWKVPPGELATEPSMVVHSATGRRMTYGEIAAFAEPPATMPKVSKAELKSKENFRLIGNSIPRHDNPAR